MYLPVQGSIIVALQADAGKELWKFDLKTLPGHRPESVGGRPRHLVLARHARASRRASSSRPPTGSSCSSTRRPASRFPARPAWSTWRTGVMEKFGGSYSTNMPPALYKNLAIIAARTGEQGRYGIPGDPRAFDLLTGKEVWRFHVVPQPGDENFGTWGLNGWQDRRGPGVWVPMVGRSRERPGLRLRSATPPIRTTATAGRARTSTPRRCWCCRRRPASASGTSR